MRPLRGLLCCGIFASIFSQRYRERVMFYEEYVISQSETEFGGTKI